MDILEISNLVCKYNDLVAVNKVSFQVDKGEFIGLIGPNGSGKSTILRSISRVIKPVQGTVSINGIDVSNFNTKELARQMAVVPEDTTVSFSFTVLDIVLMGRAPHLGRFELEREKDLVIARQAMRMTDTLYLEDRFIDELSSGEKQRVVIAQSLAQEPKIMLLDEPTAHLDINHEVEIFDLLKKLQAEIGMTIIIVSHDLNLAAQYCRRLILLKNGEIFKQGNPEEVITEDNIKSVYGIKVLVESNHRTKAPNLILLPGQ
jgi:iron complex transport system ATP-binding protein